MTIRDLQFGDIVQHKDGRNYVVVSAATDSLPAYCVGVGYSYAVVHNAQDWVLAKRHDWAKPMDELALEGAKK